MTADATGAEELYTALKYRVVVTDTGTRYYNSTGQLHRDEGPAIEWNDGTKEWHHNGRLHRTDGPAIEWWDGSKGWYLQGVHYSESGYYVALKDLGIQNDH